MAQLSFFAFLCLICSVAVSYAASAWTTNPKIGPVLKGVLANTESVNENIFISFGGIQEPLALVNHASKRVHNRGQKNTLIYKTLLSHSIKSQGEAVSSLKALGISEDRYQSFWITNQLYVKGADANLIKSLISIPAITMVEQEALSQLQRPIIEGPVVHQDRDAGVLAEWNVEKMGAHLVWEAPWGNNGTGVVVGFIDTGVRGTHEAIVDQYVNDGKAWRDPYNQYMVPTDVYNHGTHTVGSVLGRFGIGMAPDAKWIACKGYADDGSATTAAFTECGQFMVCPTDANGGNPDCTKTPHVTSNSWGVWPGSTYFEDVLDVWNAAGIVSLFSNGNEGPTPCGDMLAPADSAKTLGVGASGSNDQLADWSSRGPSRYGVMKPDITAPGMSIRSCDCRGDSLYITMSGTSMSCPNASGIAALMAGKDRNITPARVKSILQSTATRSSFTSGQTCGGVPDTTYPNNHFGAGIINGYQAVLAV